MSLTTLEKVLDGSEEVRLISVCCNEILIINDVADKWMGYRDDRAMTPAPWPSEDELSLIWMQPMKMV